MFKRTILITALVLAAGFGSAIAQCNIAGECSAEWAGADPAAPAAWKYTLTVTWDTDSPYGVSHVDLLPGAKGRCTCDDLEAGILWVDPVGESDGDPAPCTVGFNMFLECDGDPSLGIDEPLFKFEYIEDTGCEPSNTGMMTAVFYSPFPPAMIEEPNLALVDKHAQLDCWGQLSGVFPALPCDPLPSDAASWGAIKSLYGVR